MTVAIEGKTPSMNAEQFLMARNAYGYPAVALNDAFEHLDFSTTRDLEEHHYNLLRSANDKKAILGYLSVVYWGHYSGKNGIPRGSRALARVRLAHFGAFRLRNGSRERINGVEDIGLAACAQLIGRAAIHVDAGRCGEALRTLCDLPGLQFAFASKVVAFLLPDRCGVIDSVIAEKCPGLGFVVDRNGYIRNNGRNANAYETYCATLVEKALALNALGEKFQWTDRDGKKYSWRAIDVERAIYSGPDNLLIHT